MANQTFENLTQSGLVKIPSKDDRNVSFTLGVWGGNTSFEVFETQGAKPWKLSIPPKTRIGMLKVLKKIAANPIPCKESIDISEWVEKDNGKKALQKSGVLAFGIDETHQAFIDIGHNGLNNRHIFIIKADPRFSFAETSLTEKDLVQASLEWLIETLQITVPMAERLTSFKRDPNAAGGKFGGAGGGGNKSGGGFSGGGNSGGGNRGNYSGGGGGGRQSNSFGGSPDVQDDLHV